MGKKAFHGYVKQIDEMYAGREWLSDKYLVLDPYAFVSLRVGRAARLPMAELKNYSAFKDRMLKRPAVERVVADERPPRFEKRGGEPLREKRLGRYARRVRLERIFTRSFSTASRPPNTEILSIFSVTFSRVSSSLQPRPGCLPSPERCSGERVAEVSPHGDVLVNGFNVRFHAPKLPRSHPKQIWVPEASRRSHGDRFKPHSSPFGKRRAYCRQWYAPCFKGTVRMLAARYRRPSFDALM